MGEGRPSLGLVVAIVMGVAFLIIGTIIAFVIISTLDDASLLTSTRTSGSKTNETTAWINRTGYQLKNLDANYIPGSITISQALNTTLAVPVIVPATNYSVSSTGLIYNATTLEYPSANFTYTYSIYSVEEQATTNMDANFSSGIDKVSAKVPTVFLVAAIVLILSTLAILVGLWKKMRMGGSGI